MLPTVRLRGVHVLGTGRTCRVDLNEDLERLTPDVWEGESVVMRYAPQALRWDFCWPGTLVALEGAAIQAKLQFAEDQLSAQFRKERTR